MKNPSIYFSADTEVTEYEAINKGYRVDVYVIKDEKVFRLRVYSLVRLQQDFRTEWETSGRYYLEPNLVLVRSTNIDEIINTVNGLYLQGYLDYIKPIDCIDISELVKIQ
jgi:hypothetical protein